MQYILGQVIGKESLSDRDLVESCVMLSLSSKQFLAGAREFTQGNLSKFELIDYPEPIRMSLPAETRIKYLELFYKDDSCFASAVRVMYPTYGDNAVEIFLNAYARAESMSDSAFIIRGLIQYDLHAILDMYTQDIEVTFTYDNGGRPIRFVEIIKCIRDCDVCDAASELAQINKLRAVYGEKYTSQSLYYSTFDKNNIANADSHSAIANQYARKRSIACANFGYIIANALVRTCTWDVAEEHHKIVSEYFRRVGELAFESKLYKRMADIVKADPQVMNVEVCVIILRAPGTQVR